LRGVETFRNSFHPTITSASCNIKDGATGLRPWRASPSAAQWNNTHGILLKALRATDDTQNVWFKMTMGIDGANVSGDIDFIERSVDAD
jgi:hypothetical protein